MNVIFGCNFVVVVVSVNMTMLNMSTNKMKRVSAVCTRLQSKKQNKAKEEKEKLW